MPRPSIVVTGASLIAAAALGVPLFLAVDAGATTTPRPAAVHSRHDDHGRHDERGDDHGRHRHHDHRHDG